MVIPVRVQRNLEAASGGRCYYPGCSERIIQEGERIGEWAHIESNKGPNAPRYNASMTDIEYNSFENIMIMCSIHHTKIDYNELTRWSAEELKKIKEKHEQEQLKEIILNDDQMNLIRQEFEKYTYEMYDNINLYSPDPVVFESDECSFHYKLGETFVDNGEYEIAVVEFEKILEKESNEWVYNYLGIIYDIIGMSEKSTNIFLLGLKKFKTSYALANNLGLSNAEKNQLGEAEKYYKLAIGFDKVGQYYQAWYNIGNLYFKQQKYDYAKAAYLNVLKINNGHFKSKSNLAAINLNLHNYEIAIKEFEELHKLSNDDITLKYNLSVAYYKTHQFDRAEFLSREVLKLDKGNIAAMTNLHRILNDQNKLDVLIKDYQEYLKTTIDQGEMWHNYGLILRKVGKMNEAGMSFDKAKNINPEMPDTWLALSAFYIFQNNITKAIDILLESLKYVEDSRIYGNLANIYYKLQDKKNFYKYYDKYNSLSQK